CGLLRHGMPAFAGMVRASREDGKSQGALRQGRQSCVGRLMAHNDVGSETGTRGWTNMAAEEEVIDTAVDWQLKHIRSYVESNGEEGHIWRGVPTLLLTTRGRRSGKLRRTPLIYGEDGGRYIIVGS